jgi:hypothetical protein
LLAPTPMYVMYLYRHPEEWHSPYSQAEGEDCQSPYFHYYSRLAKKHEIIGQSSNFESVSMYTASLLVTSKRNVVRCCFARDLVCDNSVSLQKQFATIRGYVAYTAMLICYTRMRLPTYERERRIINRLVPCHCHHEWVHSMRGGAYRSAYARPLFCQATAVSVVNVARH